MRICKTNNTNELYHFGIPGMKWGHRTAGIVSNQKPKTRFDSFIKKDGYEPRKPIFGDFGVMKDGPKPQKISIGSRTKLKNKDQNEKQKKQISKGKKIAIGAIASIGTMAAAATIYKNRKKIVDSYLSFVVNTKIKDINRMERRNKINNIKQTNKTIKTAIRGIKNFK